MTAADVEQPPSPAGPSGAGTAGRIAALLGAAMLVAALALAAGSIYYAGVPEPADPRPADRVVSVPDLPLQVVNTFVAAVDPKFYRRRGMPLGASLITRRYIVISAGMNADEVSSSRTRIMAVKFEEEYSRQEILGFYLSCADFGPGTRGLAAAARAYFGSTPAQLTIGQAAVLAARLDPAHPEPRAGWNRVLDTMVDQGWLEPSVRESMTYPG